MNLSLRNRVTTSFVVANVVVWVLSFLVFSFLNSLSQDIDEIVSKSNRVTFVTDQIRISAVSLIKHQRKLMSDKTNEEIVRTVLSECDELLSHLNMLESLYSNKEIQKVLSRMILDVERFRLYLGKGFHLVRDQTNIDSVESLSDKILETFTEFQDVQNRRSSERNEKIIEIIKSTKRNMMITLIIGFLGTIALGLVIPGKIALPFKKIKDAIRELQDCNFDVSIFYNQDDEIGEIAREMNKMIVNFKLFEELRADRISLEHRKFDALANVVKKPVLVADATGKLIYMNSRLYSLLQVSSEDVIGKEMTENTIPPSIIKCYELAIKRRSKIENSEIIIPAKGQVIVEEGDLEIIEQEQEQEQVGDQDYEQEAAAIVDSSEVIVEPPIFEGFANVIPIRGKDSSLDCYLMVLSAEVFV